MDNDPLASLMSFFLVHDLVFTAETCAVERQTGLHAKLVSKGIVPLDFYRVHKSLQGLHNRVLRPYYNLSIQGWGDGSLDKTLFF